MVVEIRVLGRGGTLGFGQTPPPIATCGAFGYRFQGLDERTNGCSECVLLALLLAGRPCVLFLALLGGHFEFWLAMACMSRTLFLDDRLHVDCRPAAVESSMSVMSVGMPACLPVRLNGPGWAWLPVSVLVLRLR